MYLRAATSHGGRACSPEPNEATEVAFLRNHYLVAVDAWRRFDHDWLAIGADLAMQLDDRTNNQPRTRLRVCQCRPGTAVRRRRAGGQLVELAERAMADGRQDTQGNRSPARTVFYKVGHHGSGNATLKTKDLQLMIGKDLSAFIPTNRTDALKVKWGRMPFEKLLEDFEHRTDSRIIRADDA